MSFFLLLSTKEDILKNVSNQTIDGSHWLPCYCFYYVRQWLPSTVLSKMTVMRKQQLRKQLIIAKWIFLHKLFSDDFHITSTYYIITNSNLKVLTSQRKLFWKCLLDKWFWTFKTNSKQTFYCSTHQFILRFCLKYTGAFTGAGHIIRISSKSWFISLIPFKKWNLYNVYIHSTQTDIFQVFISFNFDDYTWQLMKTPNSVSQKIRILWKGSILKTPGAHTLISY